MDSLIKLFDSALFEINTLKDLENLRVDWIGRQGKLNVEFKRISSLSSEEKKTLGQNLNKIKKQIEIKLEITKKKLISEQQKSLNIDVTIPGVTYPRGSLHPITYAAEEVSKIFNKLGFIRVSYPEVEWEYFAFEALNMPKSHPARDDFESCFVDGPTSPKYGTTVLSPHTSSGQVREMWRQKNPPIRMINFAKCYRLNWDATHTPMFHQFEGLCIDENINITHLKGTIDFFAKAFFGQDRQTRLRPHHFQFTEPSFEVDISCDLCGGTGMIKGKKCKVCKSGWLELGGAGMVHPHVLQAGNIDLNKYSGWAFGFGIERIYMMKQNMKIDDMRIMYNGDLNFLNQF